MTVTEAPPAADVDPEGVEFRGDTVWASYSALVKHRACPQRWAYDALRRVEKLLDPDVPPVERDLGNWWHALMAADSIQRAGHHGEEMPYLPLELRTTDGGPVVPTRGEHPVARVLDACRGWWERQSPLAQARVVEVVGEATPDRLAYLYARWSEQWAGDRAYEHPLGVEVHWRRELPMPAGLPKVVLTGYVDEVFYDARRNLVTVRDHKSHKTLDSATAATDLMDSQLQLYVWGASPTITSWGRGKVQAIGYDRVRTVKPKTPLVTASGGLSKSVTDYDLHTYREMVDGPGADWGTAGEFFASGPRRGLPKFGRYEAEESVLEKLASPSARSVWHQRTRSPLNAVAVRAHLQAAVDSAVDIVRTRGRYDRSGSAPRNLSKENCRWCDFAKLCRVEMIGGVGGEYVLADLGLAEKGPRRR